MQRTSAWRRRQDYLHTKRKCDIIKHVYQSNYMKHNGSFYNKNKVHCGCPLCKPYKHYPEKSTKEILWDLREKEEIEEYFCYTKN